jgi:hypothetical protein
MSQSRKFYNLKMKIYRSVCDRWQHYVPLQTANDDLPKLLQQSLQNRLITYLVPRSQQSLIFSVAASKTIKTPGNPYWRVWISTIDLLVLTSSDQIILIQKMYVFCFVKQALAYFAPQSVTKKKIFCDIDTWAYMLSDPRNK